MQTSSIQADSLFLNGNIYTINKNQPQAEAMAVAGQTIIYIGDNATALTYASATSEIHDLNGMTVVPGLIEGHMHFPGLGERLLILDLYKKSKSRILDEVQEAVNGKRPGEWIVGRGWNQEDWNDGRWPTKNELDQVAPDNPVLLTRACGHCIWVNSLALERAGISIITQDLSGGEIIRAANGEPLGILTDTAAAAVTSCLPNLASEEQEATFLKAQEELFKYGITSCCDAGSNTEQHEIMHKMYTSGSLKVRIYGMVNVEEAELATRNGPSIGLYQERFTIRAVKIFADGSLGARSAWLTLDYSDRPGHRGNPTISNSRLLDAIKLATGRGFQVATHAIGDAAVQSCIGVYEEVLSSMPEDINPRWRIEHFQIASTEDIQRAVKLGIMPAMQAVHAISDRDMAFERLGHKRIDRAYRWREVIDAGLSIIGGSDAPVEPVNPFVGIYSSVCGALSKEQNMTRDEALRSFTIWAAYGQFEENIKGSLEVGKLADFCIINKDIMTCPTEDILEAEVLLTVCGGEIVYTK